MQACSLLTYLPLSYRLMKKSSCFHFDQISESIVDLTSLITKVDALEEEKRRQENGKFQNIVDISFGWPTYTIYTNGKITVTNIYKKAYSVTLVPT